jgi:uncharacterized protein (DUF924 family)
MANERTATHWSDVLTFWFGAPDSPEFGRQRLCWFRKTDDFDALIRDRFGAMHERAARGELAAWADRPLSALALTIVLDQFSRNMFRGEPRAFATDAMALSVARMVVERGFDDALLPAHRWFAYLPFEHAEDLDAQRQSLELFEQLRDDPASATSILYAAKHYAVIARFGRFPHRNAILGRVSTATELVFLAQPGSSF